MENSTGIYIYIFVQLRVRVSIGMYVGFLEQEFSIVAYGSQSPEFARTVRG